MIESIDTSLIDWSRAQFAMTAMYHWIFVPLTLGLAVVMGIMETLYYKTGNEFWKKTAQFWMKLFGINFAIGVATGLAHRLGSYDFRLVDSRCQRMDAASGRHGIQS